MLRARLGEELKLAMKAKDARRTSTLRLIIAALKDREIAARGDGGQGTIGDEDVLNMLATMVRQRGESIELYRQGGREDLVRQEEEEAAIISSFLPKQLGEAEIREASREVTAESARRASRTWAGSWPRVWARSATPGAWTSPRRAASSRSC